MTNIKVISQSWTHVTIESDPNDDWSRDSTYTDWSFDGIEIVSEKNYFDVITEFDVKPNTTYYLVLVVYHSGDSFGHDENYSVEYIDLYQDEQKAKEAVKTIKNHSSGYSRQSNGNDSLIITFANDVTKEIKYVPWHNYFSGVGSIQVVPVSL